MAGRNETRSQVPPELLEQYVKQQETQYVQPNQNVSGYSVPTDFVELPSSGEFYTEDHPWHKKEKVEVRFMTTKEEDILTSPTYNREGVAFDKLIESILVDRVSVESLLIGDKNAILLNARKNAYGSEYHFYSLCQKCLEGKELTANLEELTNKDLSQLSCTKNSDGTFKVELPKSKDVIQFRLITGTDEKMIREQEKIREKHNLPPEKVISLHRQLIVSINERTDRSYIDQYIQKMLIKDSRFLQKVYEETRPDVIFSYEHSCDSCGHQSKGVVPIGADFFWPDG